MDGIINLPVIQQYKGLSYELRISPTDLYNGFFILLTSMNVYFIITFIATMTNAILISCIVALILIIIATYLRRKESHKIKSQKQENK